ncbi:MAG: phosphatidate cytidylyltransferase [Deltaproteobacteria bacterium]|nr:phosphatidate cytidylyltransferase [Deltaproteobacteria bacterium]MBI4373617.1 phosphatidate cytidylyltransferase [Deltaproteobacteria bacterium]
MLRRVLSVLVAVPIILAVLFSPWPVLFKLLVVFCQLFALHEYSGLVQLRPAERKAFLVVGGLSAFSLGFVPFSAEGLLLWVAFLVILVFIYYLLGHEGLEGIGPSIGLTLLGIFYVALLPSFIARLRDFPQGAVWILLLLAMTWFNDTAAYFAGHWWGRRRLAPKVSPGKTWEGFWAGFIGSLIAFVLIRRYFYLPLTFSQGLLLVGIVGMLAPAGDLSESLLKRGFGVKDSGHLIPGHGGLLDRIDALLFVAPVVYAFAKYFSG